MFKDADAGVVIVVLIILIEAALIFFPHAALAPELMGRVMGTLDASALAIVGYRWGSSQSSKDKTALLAQANAIPPEQVSLSQPENKGV